MARPRETYRSARRKKLPKKVEQEKKSQLQIFLWPGQEKLTMQNRTKETTSPRTVAMFEYELNFRVGISARQEKGREERVQI
jgi:hypothetical protein